MQGKDEDAAWVWVRVWAMIMERDEDKTGQDR